MPIAIQHSPLKRYAYTHFLASSPHESDHQFFRLYFVTQCYNPKELAAFLGVHIKDVIKAQKNARKGDSIPAQWLFFVLRTKSVHPDWIVTGHGAVDWECVFRKNTSTDVFLERWEKLVSITGC